MLLLIELLKLLTNSCIKIVDSEFFLTPFIIYCVSFYSFLQGMIYYYTRIAPCPTKVYIILGSVILGCVIGEIVGLSMVWYKENIYLPSLDDCNNINIEPPINNSELNELQSDTHQDLLDKNKKNTIKWFCIIYFAFIIFYQI